MAATPFDLKLFTSGSGVSGSHELNLGGVIGVELGDYSGPGGIAGITVLGTRGVLTSTNTGTVAAFVYEAAGPTVKFRGIGGSTYGTVINIGTDGTYFVPDDGDFPVTDGRGIWISVVAASLPVGNTTSNPNITAQTLTRLLFGVVPTTEQDTGGTRYRCFYLSNEHGISNIQNLKMYIGAQPDDPDSTPPVADTFELGADPVGIGDGSTTGVATTIGNETGVPTGVTFSLPTYGAPLVLGTLTPGDRQAIWVKQVVPLLSFTESVTGARPQLLISLEMELP
jgi:hypothetical protein